MSRRRMNVLKYIFGKNKRRPDFHYGEEPDVHYFAGDMEGIRTYYDYRRDNHLDDFLIDDTTWNDLSMDDVYKRINQGHSTSGEQYLYYLLRSPCIEKGEYEKRKKMIEMIEQHPDIREEMQMILYRLGKRRAANICEAFKPFVHSKKKFFLYVLLALLLIGSGVGIAFTSLTVLPFIGFLIFIPIYHQIALSRMESDLATVNYSVAMVTAQEKIKKLGFSELDEQLTSFYEAGARLKSVLRIGSVGVDGTDVMQIVNSVLLLDLMTYELLKNQLGKHHEDIFHIHEYLGRMDAAIAIASYRKSVEAYTVPKIDFSPDAKGRFHGNGLVHPLIRNAVPNNLDTTNSLLLTGSNASGKSTFLKTAALNAIMAQSICTVLCEDYTAVAFRVYASMAIADNLIAGESYYITEIKSLKRIADAAAIRSPMLCVVDEVLRGTNTVERIAASGELLKSLRSDTTLCFAATHDIELCAILGQEYRLLHFEETVTQNGEILFDYRIKEGPATTRNALKLLRSMGFDRKMVERADERANQYMTTGKWMI